MPKTFIESIFCGLYADKPDNDEVMYYWNTLFENIVLFSDPKHKNTVEDYFYDIVCGLCRAQELQGFKEGLSHSFRLAAECFATPDLTTNQAKQAHESLHIRDLQYPVEPKTNDASPPTSIPNPLVNKTAPPATTTKTEERDYIDEMFVQIARADEAITVLETALELVPSEKEIDRRDASKLLSAALDIFRDAIPKANSVLSEYLASGKGRT